MSLCKPNNLLKATNSLFRCDNQNKRINTLQMFYSSPLYLGTALILPWAVMSWLQGWSLCHLRKWKSTYPQCKRVFICLIPIGINGSYMPNTAQHWWEIHLKFSAAQNSDLCNHTQEIINKETIETKQTPKRYQQHIDRNRQFSPQQAFLLKSF